MARKLRIEYPGATYHVMNRGELTALEGDLRTIEIAEVPRKETTMTVKWMTQRLQMGSVAYVNNRLYFKRKGRLKSKISR